MNRVKALLMALLLFAPAAAFAGQGQGRIVPTLGEIGLVILGASLVGGGAFALRRRKR